MFCRLSDEQLADLLPFFRDHPRFALFANAAKFEVEKRMPNHPCDFYLLKTETADYFYCFRHNRLPDNFKPILMIGSHGDVKDDDVTLGMKHLKAVEPDLHKIFILAAYSNISTPARKFMGIECDLEEYSHETCYNYYVPRSMYPKVQEKVDAIQLPPSFTLGSTRVSDCEIINNTWKFATPDDVLQQKESLIRHPTACIYHDDKPISFELVGLHGQLDHQYTFPEYRNRGFGTIIETSIVNKCISEGIVPVKSVELLNGDVIKRSFKNPLWQVVTDDDGKPFVHDYVALRPRSHK